jgi:phage tail sheath protein FI
MPGYVTPGVYVEEIPSSVKPIAGASTSTAGFIGIIPDSFLLPANDPDNPGAVKMVTFPPITTPPTTLPAMNTPVLVTNWTQFTNIFGGLVGDAGPAKPPTPPPTPAASGTPPPTPTPPASATPPPTPAASGTTPPAPAVSPTRTVLAQAVYGFFNNGGSRCYVARVATGTDVPTALLAFAAIEEIAIVAMPGNTDDGVQAALTAHCVNNGCFAIFDGPAKTTAFTNLTTLPNAMAPKGPGVMPKRTDTAAFYFPWITVVDPSPDNKTGRIDVPPSGHIAGVYARVDTQRGVHKAPANEVILGALGVTQAVSKNDQGDLNKNGVNCIRVLNGNILVWGARTVGGDANADLKYINVRRTLLFLRKSIEEGTQWVVFEPNTLALWQKISRNVTAFLTNVWRSGALFGATPQEAFYVKCDAETNPPELRDVGQVVTEIGVAIVRPAEFVIFRISQYTAPPK